MKIDTEIRHVTKPGANLFLEALWDKKPRDRAQVNVRRKRRFGVVTTHTFDIELAAASKPSGKS